MKKPFYVTVDCDTSGVGFIVMAYSREQVDRIFGLPQLSGMFEVFEDFDEHPLYRFDMDLKGRVTTYDVDNPKGTLLHYMVKNKVIVPVSKMPSKSGRAG